MSGMLALTLAATLAMPMDEYHSPTNRRFTGIPSVAVSQKTGRLWMTYYASCTDGEDSNNYSVLATSADNGESWKEVLVADPDGKGPVRSFDPEVWIGPDNRLRWTWSERVTPVRDGEKNRFLDGGRELKQDDRIWMTELDPDTELVKPSPAREIGRGIMMCKPIVTKDGRWLFPNAHWGAAPSACVLETRDAAQTFRELGGVTLPEKIREYDEHNLVELRDGRIRAYMRTDARDGHAIWEAESADGGTTWGEPRACDFLQRSSRICVRRLKGGRLLLVKNGKLDEKLDKREKMMAFVSDDDGRTWRGGLMLWEKFYCSYPDCDQGADGTIYLVFDGNRFGENREMYFVRFTVDDVLARQPVSSSFRLVKLHEKNGPARVFNDVPNVSPKYGDVILTGPFGDRLDALMRNHVKKTDARRLTDYYRWKMGQGEGFWHTEFWGKYMHSAVPFLEYAKDEGFRRQIVDSFENLLPLQEKCGYLGNYPDETRLYRKWSVWGTKYTMLGLLLYHDGLGDKRALDAARRLCDYLIEEVGPNPRRGRPLRHTGYFGGLPSCSLLEPVVWLYRRTNEKRYLDFAAHIVGELCDCPDGPQMLKFADVPVADRRLEQLPPADVQAGREHPEISLLKSYEFMSCCQGLLEYYEVTGRREYLTAVLKAAESIAETEITLAGSASSEEVWFHGADRQYQHRDRLQETCVTTTWMRLCEKLLGLTGDPRWADRLEVSFYNAYLAAMKPDAGVFAAYTPLSGFRSTGAHHCRTHHNCCNANGPRGYLTVLDTLLQANGDAAIVNFYMSGHARVTLPATGKPVEFQTYTTYPRTEKAELWYQSPEEQTFTLKLRIPAFSNKTVVKMNGRPIAEKVVAGTYLAIRRTWKNADRLEIAFELPVRMYRLHDHVAFTRGPVCLARDSRFADGALDDEIRARNITPTDLASFKVVRRDDPLMFLAVSATLPVGLHTEDPDNGAFGSTVHFTDYASAGNHWRPDNRYRVWLPELLPGRNY